MKPLTHIHRHHKITHDTEKTRKHKCPDCESRFRYPKDVERHHGSIHSAAQYFCADCRKEFKRRDHLDRHMGSKGHVATVGATSLMRLSPMGPSTSTNAYDKSSIVDGSHPDSQAPSRSYGYAAQLRSFDQQSLSRLDPFLQQPSPFKSTSFTTGSIDDTFTVSEDNSFWSDQH